MNALEAVIKGLNDALVALKGMTAQAKAAVEEATIVAAALKAQQAKLTDEASLLAEREKAISDKETNLLVAEELAAERDKVESIKASLENEKQAFARACSEKKAVLDQQAADIISDKSALDAGWAQLAKDKATFKAEILKTIKGAVDK